MGRRALRRIDPALDLTTHFKTLEEIPLPWNAAALFERAAPLEVEVGSGKGMFLAAAAAGDPEANFLGIEIVGRYARFTAARLIQRGLTNARIIEGDTQRFFAEWLPDACLRGVHVYFPDPWWKARHRKRRVLSEPFVRHVERVLVPGGTLHFWTDVEEYFQTSLELIPQVTRLTGPWPVAERPADHDLDYRTHFERRTRLHGEPVYRAEFRKESPAPR